MIANNDKTSPFADYEVSQPKRHPNHRAIALRKASFACFLLFLGMLGASSQLYTAHFNAQVSAPSSLTPQIAQKH
jgi:hypothetical protein